MEIQRLDAEGRAQEKGVYYLIPFDGAFLLSLTIREAEKDSILSNPAHEGFVEIVTAARKYPEGYNVQFEICDAESFAMAKEFVMLIMAQR